MPTRRAGRVSRVGLRTVLDGTGDDDAVAVLGADLVGEADGGDEMGIGQVGIGPSVDGGLEGVEAGGGGKELVGGGGNPEDAGGGAVEAGPLDIRIRGAGWRWWITQHDEDFGACGGGGSFFFFELLMMCPLGFDAGDLGADVVFEDGEKLQRVFGGGEEIGGGIGDVLREGEVEHLTARGPGMEDVGEEAVGELSLIHI